MTGYERATWEWYWQDCSPELRKAFEFYELPIGHGHGKKRWRVAYGTSVSLFDTCREAVDYLTDMLLRGGWIVPNKKME